MLQSTSNRHHSLSEKYVQHGQYGLWTMVSAGIPVDGVGYWAEKHDESDISGIVVLIAQSHFQSWATTHSI